MLCVCYISGLTFLIKTKYMGKFMQTHNHYLNTTFTIIIAVITIPTHTILAMCYQCFCCIVNTFIFNIMKVSSSYFLTHTHSFLVLFCFGSQCYYDYFFLQLNLCHCLLFSCFVYYTFHKALNIQLLNNIMVFHLCISLTIRIVFCFYFPSFQMYFSKSICG